MSSRRAADDCLKMLTLGVANVSCGDLIFLENENTVFQGHLEFTHSVIQQMLLTAFTVILVYLHRCLKTVFLEGASWTRPLHSQHLIARFFITKNCRFFETCRLRRRLNCKTLARDYYHGEQQTIAWKHWRLLLVRVAVSGLSWIRKHRFFMVKSNSCICSYFRCCWPYWKC